MKGYFKHLERLSNELLVLRCNLRVVEKWADKPNLAPGSNQALATHLIPMRNRIVDLEKQLKFPTNRPI